MQGDFIRRAAHPGIRRSADRTLLLQQGRVLLDSDYNRAHDMVLAQIEDLGKDALCRAAFRGSALRVGHGVLLLDYAPGELAGLVTGGSDRAASIVYLETSHDGHDGRAAARFLPGGSASSFQSFGVLPQRPPRWEGYTQLRLILRSGLSGAPLSVAVLTNAKLTLEAGGSSVPLTATEITGPDADGWWVCRFPSSSVPFGAAVTAVDGFLQSAVAQLEVDSLEGVGPLTVFSDIGQGQGWQALAPTAAPPAQVSVVAADADHPGPYLAVSGAESLVLPWSATMSFQPLEELWLDWLYQKSDGTLVTQPESLPSGVTAPVVQIRQAGAFVNFTPQPVAPVTGIRIQLDAAAPGRWLLRALLTRYAALPTAPSEVALGDGPIIQGPQAHGQEPGRATIDGIRVSRPDHLGYWGQPDLPFPISIHTHLAEIVTGQGTQGLLFYLDVWERAAASAEDLDLQEVALDGADTVAGRRTVAQVKVLPQVASLADAKAALQTWTSTGTGTLSNIQLALADTLDPCALPPQGAYRGTENRLYRVEVHALEERLLTLKWSRDNASLIGPIIEDVPVTGSESIQTLCQVRVANPERFAPGDLVEVIDCEAAVGDVPATASERPQAQVGSLRVLTGVDPTTQTLTWYDPDKSESSPPDTLHAQLPRSLRVTGPGAPWAYVRRWTDRLVVDLSQAPSPFELEEGVTILLDHRASATYFPRDFWTMAARGSDGSVEPLDRCLPEGPRHRYVPLSWLSWQGGSLRFLDLRRIVPPLCELRAQDIAFDGAVCNHPDVQTLQDALEELCKQHGGGLCVVTVGPGGEFPEPAPAIEALREREVPWGCICLLAGVTNVTQPIVFKDDFSLHLHGCGPSAVLWDARGENATGSLIRIEGSSNIEISHLAIASPAVPAIIEVRASGSVASADVRLDGLTLLHGGILQVGQTPNDQRDFGAAVLLRDGAKRVAVANCLIAAPLGLVAMPHGTPLSQAAPAPTWPANRLFRSLTVGQCQVIAARIGLLLQAGRDVHIADVGVCGLARKGQGLLESVWAQPNELPERLAALSVLAAGTLQDLGKADFAPVGLVLQGIEDIVVSDFAAVGRAGCVAQMVRGFELRSWQVRGEMGALLSWAFQGRLDGAALALSGDVGLALLETAEALDIGSWRVDGPRDAVRLMATETHPFVTAALSWVLSEQPDLNQRMSLDTIGQGSIPGGAPERWHRWLRIPALDPLKSTWFDQICLHQCRLQASSVAVRSDARGLVRRLTVEDSELAFGAAGIFLMSPLSKLVGGEVVLSAISLPIADSDIRLSRCRLEGAGVGVATWARATRVADCSVHVQGLSAAPDVLDRLVALDPAVRDRLRDGVAGSREAFSAGLDELSLVWGSASVEARALSLQRVHELADNLTAGAESAGLGQLLQSLLSEVSAPFGFEVLSAALSLVGSGLGVWVQGPLRFEQNDMRVVAAERTHQIGLLLQDFSSALVEGNVVHVETGRAIYWQKGSRLVVAANRINVLGQLALQATPHSALTELVVHDNRIEGGSLRLGLVGVLRFQRNNLATGTTEKTAVVHVAEVGQGLFQHNVIGETGVQRAPGVIDLDVDQVLRSLLVQDNQCNRIALGTPWLRHAVETLEVSNRALLNRLVDAAFIANELITLETIPGISILDVLTLPHPLAHGPTLQIQGNDLSELFVQGGNVAFASVQVQGNRCEGWLSIAGCRNLLAQGNLARTGAVGGSSSSGLVTGNVTGLVISVTFTGDHLITQNIIGA